MGLEIKHNEEQLKMDINDFAKFTKPVYIHSNEIRTHISLEEAQNLNKLMEDIYFASGKFYEKIDTSNSDYIENKDKVFTLLKHNSNFCMTTLGNVIDRGGGVLNQEFVDKLHNLQGLPQVRSVLEQLKDPSQQE